MGLTAPLLLELVAGVSAGVGEGSTGDGRKEGDSLEPEKSLGKTAASSFSGPQSLQRRSAPEAVARRHSRAASAAPDISTPCLAPFSLSSAHLGEPLKHVIWSVAHAHRSSRRSPPHVHTQAYSLSLSLALPLAADLCEPQLLTADDSHLQW